MLERPVFRGDVGVTVLAGEGVIAISERGSHLLKGAVHEALAQALDGRATEAIVDRLAEDFDRARLYYGIMRLEQSGLVCEAGTQGFLPQPVSPEPKPGSAAEVLPENTSLRLTMFGDVPADQCSGELARLGARLSPEGDAHVVLVDDYLRPEISDLNARARDRGEPWLLCRPVGHVVWIGPWFQPNVGPCWECLADRLRRNRPVGNFLATRSGQARPVTPPAVWSAESVRVGLHRTIGFLGDALAGDPAHTFVTLDLASGEGTSHPVVARPQCPVCGDAGLVAETLASPLRLESRRKKHTSDGGHRARKPSETVRAFSRHVDPLIGVVPEIRRLEVPETVPPDKDLLPACLFAAGGNSADPLAGLHLFSSHLRSWSGGKGITEEQARASALGEAIERYSGVFQGDEPRIRASLEELGDDAVHPDLCTLFSEQQYQDRDAWNATGSAYRTVPVRFDPAAQIDWTPVWSLTAERHRYLPTMYMYYRYPNPLDEAFCAADSNGAAAGNTLEEAILQGVLELMERDAVALWWYNRVPRPGVLLESSDVPYWNSMIERYSRMGRDLWVLDLTSDLGIPVFVGVTRKREGREEVLLGLGAHLDPEVAVSRALTEVNQMLVSRVAVDPTLLDADTRTWLYDASVDNQPYLRPAESPPTDLTTLPRQSSDDLLADVELCRSRLEARGLEMLVLDQTRPDIGVPVVKVVVPTMRFFRPRFAPGRLFDVPPELGWCDEPTSEDRLNPIAFFL